MPDYAGESASYRDLGATLKEGVWWLFRYTMGTRKAALRHKMALEGLSESDTIGHESELVAYRLPFGAFGDCFRKFVGIRHIV
jgi:hypothetical protein